MMNRREAVCALGATVASAAISPFHQASARTSMPRRIVDTHHHLISPSFAAAKGSAVQARTSGSASLIWTPEKSLAAMDEGGVSKAILSLPGGVWFGDAAESRRLAREINEFAAGAVRSHPDRFGFFATLPLPDTEGSLAEIAYALDVLKADGIHLTTSYDETYLGDKRFEPVFAELNRRGAVIYMHPTTCTCANKVPELPNPFLEFVFDTTRTIASLLFSGTLSKSRNIKWIFSHGGGTMPMVAGRIAGYAKSNPEVSARLPDGPIAELQRLYYDTANVTHKDSLAGLRAMVPASQIVFGSDFPYVPIASQVENLRNSTLSGDELAQILHRNSDRLMPARS